jgi:beta-phosphoglucomutase-like phosphatase (HAD superfamily)
MAAFVFDMDGTLADTVYSHVLSWQRALLENGIDVPAWRVHRRIGMSGGLLMNDFAIEAGAELTDELLRAGASYVFQDPGNLADNLDDLLKDREG